jgi:hypothetical protein
MCKFLRKSDEAGDESLAREWVGLAKENMRTRYFYNLDCSSLDLNYAMLPTKDMTHYVSREFHNTCYGTESGVPDIMSYGRS